MNRCGLFYFEVIHSVYAVMAADAGEFIVLARVKKFHVEKYYRVYKFDRVLAMLTV